MLQCSLQMGMIHDMSEMQSSPEPTGVPAWDVADRMRKALRVSDVGVQEIAEYLGVARNTVSTWINGRIDPSKQTLRLWALRCGVSYEWLLDGDAPPPVPPAVEEECPRLGSNQRPSA